MGWFEAHDHDLVCIESTRGKPPTCILRSPLGDYEAYSRPMPRPGYVQVPLAFWLNGWLVTLSGTALAMWMVLRDMQRGRGERDVWVPPDVARARYRLSPDTFSKGVSELAAHKLVTVRRVPQGAQEWQNNRVRNSYHLHAEQLEQRPAWAD